MATRSATLTRVITPSAISKAISRRSARPKPASVNLMLAALDHLYLFLGLGRPKVRREELPQEAPKALEPEAQKRFLRAVKRCKSVRDRALALLLFYTEVLQLCSHPVLGWPDGPPGLFGLRYIQVAAI
jgi:integrase